MWRAAALSRRWRCWVLKRQRRCSQAAYKAIDMKRQKRTVGAVVKIPFDGKWFTYGQILDDTEVVIFDVRTDCELSMDEITNQPIICRVAVSYHAITKGRWLKVGMYPISEELKKPIPKYIQ